MNVVEFVLDPEGHDGAGEIRLFVDGRDLDDFVRPVERPLWEAEMRRREIDHDRASDYRGLAPYGFGANHFMGEPGADLACGPAERTVLLSCECGEVGCWPLMARISVTDKNVTWSEFCQPHRREWDYGGLSFEFERVEYNAAIARLQAAIDGFVPEWARASET